jgi:hypothetical protein
MSYASISIDTRQINAFWQKSPELVEQELALTLSESSAFIQAHLVSNMPRGATSHLAQSITTITPVKHVEGMAAYIGTSLPYAPAVELGTRPHMPPITPLIDWVQAVLGLDGDEAKSVAMRIAWKIKAKGTEGKFMFKKTFEASQTPVESMFKQMLSRIKTKVRAL